MASAPSPIRLTVDLGATPTADRFAQLEAAASRRDPLAADPDLALDEPRLLVELAAGLRRRLSGHDRARHRLVTAALDHARAQGEIWNPTLDRLAAAHPTTLDDDRVAALWGDRADTLHAPAPAPWLAALAPWLATAAPRTVHTALAAYPAAPLLAAAVATHAPDSVLADAGILTALALHPAAIGALLERADATALAPRLQQALLPGMRDRRANDPRVVSWVLATRAAGVSDRLATALAALPPDLARRLRLPDPRTATTERQALLPSETPWALSGVGDDEAPLLLDALTRERRLPSPVTLLVEPLLAPCVLRALLDRYRQCAEITSRSVAWIAGATLTHPATDASVIEALVLALPPRDNALLARALAHPAARHAAVARRRAARRRAPEVQDALLCTAPTPDAALAAARSLARHAPDTLLTRLAQGRVRHTLPRSVLAPLLATAERERATTVLRLLSRTTALC